MKKSFFERHPILSTFLGIWAFGAFVAGTKELIEAARGPAVPPKPTAGTAPLSGATERCGCGSPATPQGTCVDWGCAAKRHAAAPGVPIHVELADVPIPGRS